jgi:hypothetical protein
MNFTSKLARPRLRRTALLLVAVLSFALPRGVPAQQSTDGTEEARSDESLDYAGSTLRVGAFFVGDLQTRIFAGTTRNPFGTQVRLDRDLGISDSVIAGRVSWEHRFNRRHSMDIDYYELSVDGHRRLERAITIRDRQLTIGANLFSSYEERIFKIGYNFTFHDEGKVALSASAGLHVSDFDLHMRASEPVEQRESSSTRAPLPVLGGRLQFRIAPKLSMFLSTDLFLFKTANSQGSLADSQLVFEHRILDRVYAGAGLSRFELDLDLENDRTQELWDWRSIYSGVYAYFALRLRR